VTSASIILAASFLSIGLNPELVIKAVPRLLERARAAGLDAQAKVDVDVAIPSAVGQAAFRIVQESLTNVVRHAGAASATVTVSVASDQLVVDVIDDGRGGEPAQPGLGLRGMAERVAALGGKVACGPTADGGWQVHAQLPLGDGRA
jgi:signal transduction histidine kinase